MQFQIRTYNDNEDDNRGRLEEILISADGNGLDRVEAEKDAGILLAWMTANLPVQTWDAFWRIAQVEDHHGKYIGKIAGKYWDQMWEEQNPVNDQEHS